MDSDPRGANHGLYDAIGVSAIRAGALRHAAVVVVVSAAIALAMGLIRPLFDKPVSWDATHVYLPMARSVISDGWAFMQRPASLMTAPLAYVYPALLGAGEVTVRWANVASFGAVIALAFLAVRRAHSLRAAIAVAFMLAVSPTLRPFVCDILTEPPFFFLMTVWALAVAQVAAPATTLTPAAPSPRPHPHPDPLPREREKRGEGGKGRGRNVAWVIVGGVALGLATLTRPAVMYFAPAMTVVLGWWWWRVRRRGLAPDDERHSVGPLAAMHAVALAIGAAWVVRNALAFGYPGIATGAGAALWFGGNPLVDGYDAVYFGMDFDSGIVQESESHLDIAGDRNLRAAAWLEFRDTPIAVLAQMFFRKTAAFLFVSSAEYADLPLAFLRAWRIALVALAVLAIAFRRRSVFVATLAALVAYMVVVHIPVMYNLRYSVGAIDIPLTLLAAIGLAEAAGSAKRAALAIAAVAIGVGFGLAEVARAAPRSPMPERIAHEVVWIRNVDSAFDVGPGTAPVEIPIDKNPGTLAWDLSMTELDLAVVPLARSQGCGWMRLRYRTPQETDFAPRRMARIPIKADGRMRKLVIGTSYPLFLRGEGVVRMEFECVAPARVEIGKMAIIVSQRQRHYLDLLNRQRRAEGRP
jgi:hypothetical protein